MRIYHDIEKLFESWKRRKLTIFGKLCVIRTLCISNASSILGLSDKKYVQKIQRLIFYFEWSKTERIQEAHGPYRSPEKTVQIKKHI